MSPTKNTNELNNTKPSLESENDSSPTKNSAPVIDNLNQSNISPRRSGRVRKSRKFHDDFQSTSNIHFNIDEYWTRISKAKNAKPVKVEKRGLYGIKHRNETMSNRNIFASLREDANTLNTNNGDAQQQSSIPSNIDIDKELTGEKDDTDLYLNYFKFPRSEENEKYKEVYDCIPKLRSSSPPRFTTKGVKKSRINHEAMGVRKLGKTLGNPFSTHGRKRNGVVFGNRELVSVDEKLKYTEAASNIKRIMKDKCKDVRFSSYVQPKILEEARDKFSAKRKRKAKPHSNEEEDEVDIETVDDSNTIVPEVLKRSLTKMKTGRKPGRTILECEDCGYKTTHSGHMRTHIMCVHKDLKQHECKYEGCDYKCSRKGSMTRHEKCVHRKDKVFRCDIENCNFESAWYISLERHIVTKHEKLRPWTCQICRKSFGQQYTLDSHINSVHRKQKRIKCAFCTFRSCTKMSVRAHILRRHKDKISEAINEAEEEDNEETEDLVDYTNEQNDYDVTMEIKEQECA
uniref:zinc finger and BTB domain-containing protein 41-like n=1 Tax=Styela clava TaxID=7725 RepID=UPI00193AAD7F|nr:zinc finger and BTB domain-containing protein 41-like [Styela clava]